MLRVPVRHAGVLRVTFLRAVHVRQGKANYARVDRILRKPCNVAEVVKGKLMGTTRNGARTVLNLVQKACKVSRTPGFRTGVLNILGPTNGADFLTAWDALCAVVDLLVGLDDFYNQIDYLEEVTGSEDVSAA